MQNGLPHSALESHTPAVLKPCAFQDAKRVGKMPVAVEEQKAGMGDRLKQDSLRDRW